MKNNIILFFIITGVCGVFIILGSVLGSKILQGFFEGQNALFVGAVIGGFIGISLGAWIATKFLLLEKPKFRSVIMGGFIGFIFASIIAVNNLHEPFIPILSISLVGIGAVMGNVLKNR